MRALILTILFAAASAGAQAQPVFSADAAAGDIVLAAATGKADLAQEARATNTATVANNAVIGDSSTGEIAFDGQALQNLSGLAVINANTGNNVAMNATMNVNIAVTPQ